MDIHYHYQFTKYFHYQIEKEWDEQKKMVPDKLEQILEGIKYSKQNKEK